LAPADARSLPRRERTYCCFDQLGSDIRNPSVHFFEFRFNQIPLGREVVSFCEDGVRQQLVGTPPITLASIYSSPWRVRIAVAEEVLIYGGS